ncbi:MAG: hypothetical protein INR67_10475 [Jatrophihabitans endophyticus]|nr:hypothetical protein [Jatrophihabitans endophyticus]
MSTPTGPVTPPPYLYRGNLPPQHTGRSTAVVVVPEHVPERHGADPAACPGLRCTTSTALPAPVSDAIQAAFPESTVEHTETVRLRGHGHVLWYREVDVRAGSEELILRVQAPARGDRSRSGHSTAPDGRQTTFLSTAYGPWFVEVEVLDYLGGQASTTLMSRLAEDPRIVA